MKNNMENLTETKALTFEMGMAEVKRWLDFKRVGSAKRVAQKGSIENLAHAFADGDLVLNDDHTITHKLKFPLSGVKELKYEPRINANDAFEKLNNLPKDNFENKLLAYAAALTGQVTGLIGKLDTEDNAIAQSIAVFFI